MKKYIFILTALYLLVGNFAYARFDLSTDTDKVTMNDNILSVKVDYFASTAQQSAQKIVYTGSTKVKGGPVLQAISGSFSVSSALNPNLNGATTIIINLDKAKHPNSTTFSLYLADNDGSNFTTDFTTPSSYSAAAGTGNYYYTTSYDLGSAPNYPVYKNDINKSFFRFTTLAACNTAWKAAIDELYTVNTDRSRKFTECFESNIVPVLTTFVGNLREYGTFSSSAPFYYYSWKQNDNTWNRSNGFKTKDACDAKEKIDYGKGIVTHCTASSTPPKIPANWDGNAVVVKQNTRIPYNSDYKLLAPIGDLDVITKDKTVGDYLNIMFKVGIGLLIALSVIMLVIHGVQYMGDESVFGKTEAMHSIRATIGGLILALGAYAILNTINPDLVNGSLDIKKISLSISADETSTGSSTTLCISPTNPPNPDDAKGTEIKLNSTIRNEYIKERDKINASLGVKLLITAQTAQEGFFPTSLSYITNNPGNIGNTDDGKIKKFNSLQEGIQAQSNIIDIVVGGKQSSYTIGGTYECALGNEKYDGSLYQYLRIYSTGARKGNAYVNTIIGYFSANGKTITARTKMSEIKNIQ